MKFRLMVLELIEGPLQNTFGFLETRVPQFIENIRERAGIREVGNPSDFFTRLLGHGYR